MVICEISVADITGDASSNVKNRGKFLGLTEAGTKNDKGQATGLDYLKQLGITHVQIMPAFDFASIATMKDTYSSTILSFVIQLHLIFVL